MAERRMFAKSIIDSDAFLDMPLSTQALYFHLSMRADDDGFVNNPKKIARMLGSGEDEFKVLFAKKFIIGFENGVVVIKHWRIHNYIAKDRYCETKYKEEKLSLSLDENNAYSTSKGVLTVAYTDCIHNVDTGKDRLGKDRLGKDRLGKEDCIKETSSISDEDVFLNLISSIEGYPYNEKLDSILVEDIKNEIPDEKILLELIKEWKIKNMSTEEISDARGRLFKWVKKYSSEKITQAKKKSRQEAAKCQEIEKKAIQTEENNKSKFTLSDVNSKESALRYLSTFPKNMVGKTSVSKKLIEDYGILQEEIQ